MRLDFNDALVMTGLGVLGTGLWLVDPRLSLTAVGFMMMIIAYLRATLR